MTGYNGKISSATSLSDENLDLHGEESNEKSVDKLQNKKHVRNDSLNGQAKKVIGIVNNVEIDRDDESLTELYSDETETPGEANTTGFSGMKKFSGFHGALDKIGLESDLGEESVDFRDNPALYGSNSSGGSSRNAPETPVSTMNRTLDETVEEIAVDIEKVNGSFGFSIQVSVFMVIKYSN